MHDREAKADYQTRIKQYHRRQNIAAAVMLIMLIAMVVGISTFLIMALGFDSFIGLLLLVSALLVLIGIAKIADKWLNEEPPKEEE